MGLTKDRMYFDYASITPVDERVIKHISKFLKNIPQTQTLYIKRGFWLLKNLEKSREKVAKSIWMYTLTKSFYIRGTESNNLAIQGVLKVYK